LNIEKQEFKRNSKALFEDSYDVEVSDDIENNQKTFQDEQEKKIRKKEKKAKEKNKEKKQDVPNYERDESKHNNQMADNDIPSIAHETKSTFEDVNHLASDRTRTFQTYSDDDNEDFVVDDIIETVESESEDDVEISQKGSNSLAKQRNDEDTDDTNNDDANNDDANDYDDNDEGLIDNKSQCSKSKQDNILKGLEAIMDQNSKNLQSKGKAVESKFKNIQRSPILPGKEVASFADSVSDDSENDDDDEDAMGGKAASGNGKAEAKKELPLDILNKFNGKTREDLISMVVEVQNTVEVQGKKISDLETYIDSLLSRVIEVAPVLLHKDVRGQNRSQGMQIFNRDLKRSKFG